MQFSISYPTNGTTKSFNIDDDNKCRIFYERRMGQEVQADQLGAEFKGYVFRISGGFDKDGFAMKQGVFCNNRIRLLMSPGSSGYRVKRKGERKRRSVRGCYVGPDIKMLSLLLVKKGDAEIPGLTDTVANRRLGPKRASGIRKLYGIEKAEAEKTSNISTALIKKHAIRRTFKSKKNAEMQRTKAPKIQRLVTDVRIRRKKIAKEDKIKRWKRTIAATAEYKKLYAGWVAQKKAALRAKDDADKAIGEKKPEEKKPAEKKPVKPVEKKPVAKEVPKTVVKQVAVSKDISTTGGAQVKAATTKTVKVIHDKKK